MNFFRKRSVAVVITVILAVLSVAYGVFSHQQKLKNEAAGTAEVPDSAVYVLDGAGVLSKETEAYIIENNKTLYNLTGGEIAVVTVRTLGGTDIAKYTRELFDQWQLGAEDRDNGLLLVLAVEEQDYWALQGDGIGDSLTDRKLGAILAEKLEADFDAGRYDDGVLATFDALTAWYSDHYAGTAYNVGAGSLVQNARRSGDGAAGVIGTILLIVLLVILVPFVVIGLIVKAVVKNRRALGNFLGSNTGASAQKQAPGEAAAPPSGKSSAYTPPGYTPPGNTASGAGRSTVFREGFTGGGKRSPGGGTAGGSTARFRGAGRDK